MRNRQYRTTIQGRGFAANFAAGFCASALLAGAGTGTGAAASWQEHQAWSRRRGGRRDGRRLGCRRSFTAPQASDMAVAPRCCPRGACVALGRPACLVHSLLPVLGDCLIHRTTRRDVTKVTRSCALRRTCQNQVLVPRSCPIGLVIFDLWRGAQTTSVEAETNASSNSAARRARESRATLR